MSSINVRSRLREFEFELPSDIISFEGSKNLDRLSGVILFDNAVNKLRNSAYTWLSEFNENNITLVMYSRGDIGPITAYKVIYQQLLWPLMGGVEGVKLLRLPDIRHVKVYGKDGEYDYVFTESDLSGTLHGYDIIVNNAKGTVTCKAVDVYDLEVGHVTVHIADLTLTISEWQVASRMRNIGIGRTLLQYAVELCMNTYGNAIQVIYNWNGKNDYVLKWLEKHFDAVCKCPIAVQKYQWEDTWDAHQYELNINKFMDYIGWTGFD